MASIASGIDTASTGNSKTKHVDISHPEYFGIKAQKNLKSVIQGRHPKSLPKNSELWHYSKLSTNRRDRIKKGHQFWDVVNSDGKGAPSKSPTPMTPGQSQAEGDDDLPDDVSALEDTETTGGDHGTEHGGEHNTAKAVSVSTKMKQVMSKNSVHTEESLALQVDFKNRSNIYYGMSFIIMNYMEEILVVDRTNELRCKPLSAVEQGDRFKFKMIDLQNPSNPQPLKFGDAMWIQCLDHAEGADNSFQSGVIMSSKLYGPPELKSVQFDIASYTKHAEADADMLSMQHSLAMPKGSVLDRGDPTAADAPVPQEAMSDAASAAEAALAAQVEAAEAEAKASKRVADQANNVAKLCGEINMIRIIDLRKDVQIVHDSVMTDEKATRYNSKQATLLGKWAVHSAVRNDSHSSSAQAGAPVVDPYVYSLTPIVIQQDMYCVGTAHPNEFAKWPLTSHSIIHGSKHISHEEEDVLNDFYEKNGYKPRPNAMADSKKGKGGGAPEAVNIKPRPSVHDEPDHSNVLCLRKIVARGFPYDFSVDRKCVWKMCLFEQFSDNSTLSEKDKTAKKVMEMANLHLKISRLNREGAHTHIAQNHVGGEHIPALVGGETFSRNLRQMIFRNHQAMEKELLHERRSHESKIEEYFRTKIQHVLDKEDEILKHGNKPRMHKSSSASITSPDRSTVRSRGSAGGGSNPGNGTNAFLTNSASVASVGVSPARKPVANLTISLKPIKSSENMIKLKSSENLARLRAAERDAARYKNPYDAYQRKAELSSTAQEIFKSDLQVLRPQQLIMNNAETINKFDNLSEGEKVLALHKTFTFMKYSCEHNVQKKIQQQAAGTAAPVLSSAPKAKVNPSVQRKLERLLLEDKFVEEVIGHKTRMDKMRNAVDLSEEMLEIEH